ncbi:LexA family protein [Brevibacillus migulae]|uniref:LexA family protein n=1 Tax=Brevibacillus migulae TaxID=1644114 RepID=UPI00106E8384|nr:transcriptional regulator [Brevibacillus migulae]
MDPRLEIQKAVLQAIMDYTAKHKNSPTISELCEMVGIKSAIDMQEHLHRLNIHGLIAWGPALPRTIRVAENGEDYGE